MKQKLFMIFSVEIESDLSKEEAIDEFQSEVEYNLPSTENVIVNNTQLLEVTTLFPL